MVGGQVLDLEGRKRSKRGKSLGDISQKDRFPSYRFYSMRSNSWFRSFPGKRNFGKLWHAFGECFQIKDDILDVTQEKEVLGKTQVKIKYRTKLL